MKKMFLFYEHQNLGDLSYLPVTAKHLPSILSNLPSIIFKFISTFYHRNRRIIVDNCDKILN